jgi:hypothetical protein
MIAGRGDGQMAVRRCGQAAADGAGGEVVGSDRQRSKSESGDGGGARGGSWRRATQFEPRCRDKDKHQRYSLHS